MRPRLSIAQILAWADSHHARTGQWPQRDSGLVQDAVGEKWVNIDRALRAGTRGLEGKSSLPKLLAEHRGKPPRVWSTRPRLSVAQILAWADSHHERTGQWPLKDSGPVDGAVGETWHNLDKALRLGLRGLEERSSLPGLLAERRGARMRRHLPPLSPRDILAWADAFYLRHQKWPRHGSGPILEAPDETWKGVGSALTQGLRGFRGGSSLRQFLKKHRRL